MNRLTKCIPVLSALFLVTILLSACLMAPRELKMAREAMNRGDFPTAYRYYQTVLEKKPNHQLALQEVNKIRVMMTNQVKNRAAEMLDSGEEATAPQLRAVLQILDQGGPYDPDRKLLGPLQENYSSRLTRIVQDNQMRVQKVHTTLASRNFSLARENLDQIKQSDPDFEEIPALESEYRASYGDFLEDKIFLHLKENDYRMAKKLFRQWEDLNLPRQESVRLQKAIGQHESDWLRREVNQVLGKRQYYKAFLSIVESWQKSGHEDTLSRVRQDGARFYFEQGKRRQEEGNLGRAYLEAVKGYELNPEYPGLFELHRDTRDQVLQKLQKYIAIPAFGAPQEDPDVGIQFSDALMSYLFRILPYGINIVEREKIDLLLEEHNRELSAVGKIMNVDLLVTGNVSLLNVEQQDAKQQSTIQVRVGEIKKINPAYEIYMNSRPRPPTPPPAQLINEAQYDKITYTKGKATLKGFATVAVRMFDSQKGSITYAQEFNANYQVSDDYQDAVEMAGIEVDPLDLPTKIEIKEKLREKIIKPLAEVIRKQFANRAGEFHSQAKYHLSRREPQKAMDVLAQGFLYCIKAKLNLADENFLNLRDLIVEQTEQNFLPGAAEGQN